MAPAARTLRYSSVFAACLLLAGMQPATRAGDFHIPGVEEGSDILRALAITFSAADENANVLVPPMIGAGGAISDVISGRAIFAWTNRNLTEYERQMGLVEWPVLEMPIVVIAHPAIERHNLSLPELEGIREGRWRSWHEIGGPDLPIGLVLHRDLETATPDPSGRRRRALLARARDVEELVRRVPGSIGLTTPSAVFGHTTEPMTLDGVSPQNPAYPLRIRLSLVRLTDPLPAHAERFIAFLRSDRGRQLIAGYGATAVVP